MPAFKSKAIKTELYRKAVHLSSLWMPLFIFTAPRNRSILLFFTLLAANLFVEYAAYQRTAVIGMLFKKMFIKTLRNREISHSTFSPSGSVYILAAALAVSVCFAPKAAAAAMCVMLIADSNAALCGRFWGSFRFYNGKSPEGTLAFFISALGIISCFFPALPPVTAFFIALTATAAEFFEKELRIDDNYTIPLVTGFLLNLISYRNQRHNEHFPILRTIQNDQK